MDFIPMPEDFRETANGKAAPELAERYGVSVKTIRRWKQEAGLSSAAAGSARKPMPEDFREAANGKAITDLAARYGVSVKTARRWMQEAGIQPAFYQGNGRKRGMDRGADSPEVIRLCLHCTRDRCGGDCLALRRARMRQEW